MGCKIRYYCQGLGEEKITNLLKKIREKHEIPYEIQDLSINGQHNNEKEKEVYEKDFKARARILKKRTGKPITQLRSHRARNYYVSLPGTIAVVNDSNQVDWYTFDKKEEFLSNVLKSGNLTWDENA